MNELMNLLTIFYLKSTYSSCKDLALLKAKLKLKLKSLVDRQFTHNTH